MSEMASFRTSAPSRPMSPFAPTADPSTSSPHEWSDMRGKTRMSLRSSGLRAISASIDGYRFAPPILQVCTNRHCEPTGRANARPSTSAIALAK
jgi:hypothetical protein